MKVLIYAGEGATRHMRFGYANAMNYIGHESLVWHPGSKKPLFDVFDEFSPNVVFCGSWEVDRPLIKNLLKRPEVKVILWGGHWGDFDSQIDYKVDPVVRTSQDEIERLKPIIKNNSIKYVFSYYTQNWMDVTHNHWRKIGLEPVGLPLAADLVTYGVSKELPELKCDVSFVGGLWPYKAVNINEYLLPLCNQDAGLNVKIFGWGDWNIAQHLGVIDNDYLPSLFKSSTINLNIFEPLASKYGFDVNERCYKVLACGGFCVSEACESAIEDIFVNKEVVFYNNIEQLKELVRYFVRHPDKREEYIINGLTTIKRKHNYFLRLKNLLTLLDSYYGQPARKLDKTIEGLLTND